MDIDITTEPLGQDADGNDVFLRDIWPTGAEIEASSSPRSRRDVHPRLRRRLRRRRALAVAADADRQHVRLGRRVDLRPQAAVLRGHAAGAVAGHRHRGRAVLAMLGDSVTTDHISPAGSIKADSPGRPYLQEHGVGRRDFNSYGSRAGNHEVMIRGTFANIRLRNQIAPGTEGGVTRDFTRAARTSIYDAAQSYAAAGTPLVVLAGKEYGSGSSRDWAAKGTALLGVRAVIAESYERIHRSNLIGMGVLPLQYRDGESAQSLGSPARRPLVTGVTGPERGPYSRQRSPCGRETPSSQHGCASTHPGRGRLLPARRHPAVRPAQPADALTARHGGACPPAGLAAGRPPAGRTRMGALGGRLAVRPVPGRLPLLRRLRAHPAVLARFTAHAVGRSLGRVEAGSGHGAY
jgi:3-isopropylmalate dehydratase small subunit